MNCSWGAVPIATPTGLERGGLRGTQLAPTVSRGRGRASCPGSFWKPRGFGHFGQRLTSPGGLPETPEARCRACDPPWRCLVWAVPGLAVSVMSGCLCAWPTDPHAEVGSCVSTKGSQRWGSCPKCPPGPHPCPDHWPLPSPAHTLPALSPGASRGTPQPLALGLTPKDRTAQSLVPDLVPASTEGRAVSMCPPAPEGEWGPSRPGGRGDSCNEWHNDSFLELKTKQQ